MQHVVNQVPQDLWEPPDRSELRVLRDRGVKMVRRVIWVRLGLLVGRAILE